MGKITKKKQSEGVRFCKFGTRNTVPYYQKCTPTYCFFGDFAHWHWEKSKSAINGRQKIYALVEKKLLVSKILVT